jgi:hypothetical protein
MLRWAGICAVACVVGCKFDPQLHASVDGSSTGDGKPPVSGPCDPLPMGGANQISVSDATGLATAIANAEPGETIVLADGIYSLTNTLQVRTTGVTIRSQSGDAAKVILDGGSIISPMVDIRASNVTVTAITLTHGGPLPLAIEPPNGSAGISGDRIYDVTFVDSVGPHVTIRAFQSNSSIGPYVDDGTIACSRFLETPTGPDLCLPPITGIDAAAAANWTVRDSLFENLSCRNEVKRTLAFDDGSRDTKVLNNVFVNSAMNIRFGNDPNSPRLYTDPPPTACGATPPDHRSGIICNNRISGVSVPVIAGNTDFEEGIALWHACDTWVIHNTIVSPAGTETFHDIENRYGDGHVNHLVNNLAEQLPAQRDGGVADFTNGNRTYATIGDFTDVAKGDLHIKKAAAQTGISIAPFAGICDLDADGKQRDINAPTVGAFVATP